MTKKILVVDDDEIFCSVLATALENYGYIALQAHSFIQCQSVIQDWLVDCAVVDLRIGDDSGLKVCQMLLNKSPTISIVMLTGFASIATAVEAIKLGVTHYLTKPTDVETILKALENEQANTNIPIPRKPMPVKRLEWEYLQKILTENKGNISKTAKQLGMHRRTLQRKLQKKPVRGNGE